MKKLSVDKKRKLISILASLLIHTLIFVLILISGISSNQLPQINHQVILLQTENFNRETDSQVTSPKSNKENEKTETEKTEKKEEISDAQYLIVNPADLIADTTNLDQLYSENTLNLSIKYPKGWTYIDQNRKNKLDGITFWSVEGIYNPPPYIHLEVVEKYLFNPNRYKYKAKQFNCEWYFNDPVNLEGQVSQEIYVRTENDEDFLIKLIMVGDEQFRSFQPKFFAIVKSLEFGGGIF